MSTKIRRSLTQATIKLMLIGLIAATLAGLIPPPLVSSLANAALPASMAKPVANAAEALLPETSIAQAGDSFARASRASSLQIVRI